MFLYMTVCIHLSHACIFAVPTSLGTSFFPILLPGRRGRSWEKEQKEDETYKSISGGRKEEGEEEKGHHLHLIPLA